MRVTKVECLACNTHLKKIECKSLDYKNLEFKNSEIFEKLIILVCPICGLGFLDEEPNSDQIRDFYVENYRNPSSPYFINYSTMKSLKLIDARSLAQIYLALSQTVFNKSDIFLDLGPGSGNSFATSKLILDNPSCYGIELNQGAQEFYQRAYGVETFQTLSLFIDQGLKAKIIILSHSLEHFKKSEVTILFEELRIALAPDGVVVIEVPNEDLLFYGGERRNDSPHLLFFNRSSISNLVTNNGFEIVALTKVGNERFSDSHILSKKKDASSSGLLTFVALTRLYQFGIKGFFYVTRRIFKNYDFLPKKQNLDLLKQFSQSEDRDCLRIVIKFNQE
jgi:hypothetical protein